MAIAGWIEHIRHLGVSFPLLLLHQEPAGWPGEQMGGRTDGREHFLIVEIPPTSAVDLTAMLYSKSKKTLMGQNKRRLNQIPYSTTWCLCPTVRTELENQHECQLITGEADTLQLTNFPLPNPRHHLRQDINQHSPKISVFLCSPYTS